MTPDSQRVFFTNFGSPASLQLLHTHASIFTRYTFNHIYRKYSANRYSSAHGNELVRRLVVGHLVATWTWLSPSLRRSQPRPFISALRPAQTDLPTTDAPARQQPPAHDSN